MAVSQRVNDPYANRTWLSLLGDMRANALENKDPIAPRPVQAPAMRAKVNAAAVVPSSPPVAAGVPELPGVPVRPSATPMAGLRQNVRRFGAAPAGSQGWMRNEGTGEVFTAEGAQTGFSQGNVGLRGRGSFSVTDIVGSTPGAQAPTDPMGTPGLRQPLISGPTASEQQAARQAAYGEKLFAPVDAANQYQPVGEGIRGKNYRQLYSDQGARSAAIARDTRIQGIMARKQMEANTNAAAVAQRPELQMLENQGRLDATNAAGQLALQQADVTGQYGLRGRAAQDRLYDSQADIAKRSTELFDEYQTETDPERKASLRESYNMLQGTKEARPQIHFGETESITDQGIVSEPYAATLDPQGGLRVLRQGTNSITPPGQQAVAARAALDPTQQANVDAYFQKFIKDNKRNATPEEVLAYIATLKK